MHMNIAIIGAGAMGSLFGALLGESGQKVTLLDVRADHVAAINAEGLKIEREGHTRRVRLAAATQPGGIGKADLALVFVKSYHTAEAARSAAAVLADGGVALTLQNGMGNADRLAEAIAAQRVIAGTTAHGATFLGPGHIRHAGQGPTVIGMWSGGQGSAILGIARLFNQAGIETRVVDDVRPVIWEKLLVNVGINAITALTGIRNGQLLDLAATRQLSRAAIQEAAAVARASGVAVRADIVEHVFQIARATSANRSSMGQDVDHRRATEIGAINGIVMQEGARRGLATPVNQALTALVETLQAHYGETE
jgi:2-dehydropantoate 2-reductase